MEDFVLKNDHDHAIMCTLRKGTLPGRLVIICVGLDDTKDIPVYVKIAELTNSAGFSVLSFNYSKDGAGFNVRDQFQDTMAVIRALQKDYSDISIIGGSLGAISTLLCLKKSDDVKRAAIANGFFGYDLLSTKLRTYLYFAKVTRFVNAKLNDTFKLITESTDTNGLTKPILLVHGAADVTVFPEQSQKFFEKIGTADKKLVIVQNADHPLTRPGNVEEVINTITDWLKTY